MGSIEGSRAKTRVALVSEVMGASAIRWITLAVRLNEGVNDALRSLIRYRGDLSTMALEAIGVVDLSRVILVSADERMVRDTTITMPLTHHRKLKSTAEDRATSMNILVNTALAHWLAGKDLLRLG